MPTGLECCNEVERFGLGEMATHLKRVAVVILPPDTPAPHVEVLCSGLVLLFHNLSPAKLALHSAQIPA